LLMFVDKVRIKVKAGDGGRGCVAFRREKGVPHGGPSGGDGGRGGSVILSASGHMRTLVDFQFRPEYKAGRGEHGMGSDCHGQDAADVIAGVPLGTMIYDETGALLGDLTLAGQQLVVATGGRGGRGNRRFASATRQAPRLAEPGERGEERTLDLELKLLADTGLVGLPNAGKSLLLSKISAAHPKVADYPFTTKEPQLGVVSLGPGESFVVADLPGLLEGAHRGVGLGHEFLRHASRTRILVHVVDAGTEKTEAELLHDCEAITGELKAYSASLLERPRILAANKLDMPGAAKRCAMLRRYARTKKGGKIEFHQISALTGAGVDRLVRAMQGALAKAPAPYMPVAEPAAIVTPRGVARVKVMRDQRGIFLVRGRELERLVASLDPAKKDALRGLQDDFDRLGVEEALSRAGAKRGDRVRIGEFEFEYSP
jgi:GTP-binding protein